MVGAAIHHDLTLIDSSDDGPFIVPRPATAPARPSRRLVLVPGSVDATPQSIQDREWTEEHVVGSDSVPETILDTLEEDLERGNRRLLLVSGSQGQGAMPSPLSEIQSEVMDTTVDDSDVGC